MNYNSDSGRYRPRVQWMEKIQEQDPEYWERNTQRAKGNEPVFRHNVKVTMKHFNQTGGFHYYQVMYGCELGDDGRITGYIQYGYDGREFMSLDTQTWTFIPTMSQALLTTQRWNSPEVEEGERHKNYLETECIEYLKKHLENGREDLERRVQPKVKVSGQKKDEILTLHCQVYGFHPKPVDVKWMKNGEDDIPTYQTTHTLPNPDGTYQIRVTAEVIPKEGDSYSCYVHHSSLKEPLNIMWEAERSGIWIIIAVVIGVLVVAILGIIGYFVYRRMSGDYGRAPVTEELPELSHKPAKV
ncbi:class I histocompatibility antigen, F10 alpha chain-like isoform X2 [Leptodactylus fuscus]